MAFAYRAGVLCAEQVSLEEIARQFGTPCYVYSRAVIEANFAHFADALAGRKSLIAYSVKANSNLAVLALMARLGAGFDIARWCFPASAKVKPRSSRRCAQASFASTWNPRPNSNAWPPPLRGWVCVRR
jgi:hypothetical protein